MARTLAPIVETTAGAIRGTLDGEVSRFLGIPYGRPLEGRAWFDAPSPALPWDDVFVADAFGPRPPQYPVGYPEVAQAEPSTHHGEGEVLTLNVWTPHPDPAANRPVMVWFYGGAYRFGYTDDPVYNGAILAAEGDLVVVTVNYRVGAEGYLALDDVPNNRALLDQVLALGWVRDEIAAFGGDPGAVTIFGESAGAGSLATLLAAPAAAGLFARAIAQSVPGTFFSAELARDITKELLQPAGIEPTSGAVAALGHERLAELVDSLGQRLPSKLRWGATSLTPTPFSPVTDGVQLPADPWLALQAGASSEVPLLVGHNRDEWMLFQSLLGQTRSVPAPIVAHAAYIWGPGDRKTANRRQRGARPELSNLELFSVEMSDGLFRMPSVHLGSTHASGGGATYLYELTWASPLRGGELGACHTLDVPLVFGTVESAPLVLPAKPTPKTISISGQMRQAWIAFAGSGNPGWDPIVEDRWLTRIFDGVPGTTLSDYPELVSREMWKNDPPATLQLGRLSLADRVRSAAIRIATRFAPAI